MHISFDFINVKFSLLFSLSNPHTTIKCMPKNINCAFTIDSVRGVKEKKREMEIKLNIKIKVKFNGTITYKKYLKKIEMNENVI